jgi:D-arabinose 1-dehydrogenase-like Zn-dependent alcohol dehydrogenase
MGQEVS